MEVWREEALLLSSRALGENNLILELIGEKAGRFAGVLRGGRSKKYAAILQPGNLLLADWQARLSQHLGTLRIEPIKSYTGLILEDRMCMVGLCSITSLLSFFLAERDPHPLLYHKSVELLAQMASRQDWLSTYPLWEKCLLEELGFGLDLETCTVTGKTDDLAYVSPRSGRAVSHEGAGEWANKLLPLPGLLKQQQASISTPKDEIISSLRLTGWFLEKHAALSLRDRPLPEARERLLKLLQKRNTASEI